MWPALHLSPHPGIRRFVVVATLACLALLAPRSAAARRLAFVNLADDAARGQAAIDALRPVIARGARLSPLGAGVARDALEAPLPPDDQDEQALARAASLLEQARVALRAFDSERATGHLEAATLVLLALAPSPAVAEMLYEVALVDGQLAAARGDEFAARAAFALARRLMPTRTALDPARYRPRLVQLYAEASPTLSATGRLRIQSEPPGATVWLDGQAIAVAPVTIPDVPAGDHVLVVTLAGHAPHGERVALPRDGLEERAVLLSRLPADARLRALRRAIPGDAAPAALADAARQLADAAAIDVLVYVRDEAGQVVATVWDPRRDTVGPFVPVDQHQTLIERVVPDVPPPADAAGLLGPDGRPLGPKPPRKPSPSPSWVRTWWGVALIAGGSVAIAGVIYVLATGDDAQAPSSLVVREPPVWLP